MKKKFKQLLAGLGILSIVSCSTMERGQLADVGTTYIAFERGFVEGNPILSGLSIAEIFAVKFVVTESIRWFVPEPVCTPTSWTASFIGYGAASWNVGVMAGSGPIGVGLYLIAAYLLKDNWIASARYSCTHKLDYVPAEIDIGLNSDWFNDKF